MSAHHLQQYLPKRNFLALLVFAIFGATPAFSSEPRHPVYGYPLRSPRAPGVRRTAPRQQSAQQPLAPATAQPAQPLLQQQHASVDPPGAADMKIDALANMLSNLSLEDLGNARMVCRDYKAAADLSRELLDPALCELVRAADDLQQNVLPNLATTWRHYIVDYMRGVATLSGPPSAQEWNLSKAEAKFSIVGKRAAALAEDAIAHPKQAATEYFRRICDAYLGAIPRIVEAATSPQEHDPEQLRFFEQLVIQTVALPLVELALLWAENHPQSAQNPVGYVLRVLVARRHDTAEDTLVARMELLVIRHMLSILTGSLNFPEWTDQGLVPTGGGDSPPLRRLTQDSNDQLFALIIRELQGVIVPGICPPPTSVGEEPLRRPKLVSLVGLQIFTELFETRWVDNSPDWVRVRAQTQQAFVNFFVKIVEDCPAHPKLQPARSSFEALANSEEFGRYGVKGLQLVVDPLLLVSPRPSHVNSAVSALSKRLVERIAWRLPSVAHGGRKQVNLPVTALNLQERRLRELHGGSFEDVEAAEVMRSIKLLTDIWSRSRNTSSSSTQLSLSDSQKTGATQSELVNALAFFIADGSTKSVSDGRTAFLHSQVANDAVDVIGTLLPKLRIQKNILDVLADLVQNDVQRMPEQMFVVLANSLVADTLLRKFIADSDDFLSYHEDSVGKLLTALQVLTGDLAVARSTSTPDEYRRVLRTAFQAEKGKVFVVLNALERLLGGKFRGRNPPGRVLDTMKTFLEEILQQSTGAGAERERSVTLVQPRGVPVIQQAPVVSAWSSEGSYNRDLRATVLRSALHIFSAALRTARTSTVDPFFGFSKTALLDHAAQICSTVLENPPRTFPDTGVGYNIQTFSARCLQELVQFVVGGEDSASDSAPDFAPSDSAPAFLHSLLTALAQLQSGRRSEEQKPQELGEARTAIVSAIAETLNHIKVVDKPVETVVYPMFDILANQILSGGRQPEPLLVAAVRVMRAVVVATARGDSAQAQSVQQWVVEESLYVLFVRDRERQREAQFREKLEKLKQGVVGGANLPGQFSDMWELKQAVRGVVELKLFDV